MAKQRPKVPGVRIVDYALIDEAGRRWEFDFDVGWRADVVELVSEVRPVRVLAGHYADTRELSSSALVGLSREVEAGVFRAGADSIVYISE